MLSEPVEQIDRGVDGAACAGGIAGGAGACGAGPSSAQYVPVGVRVDDGPFDVIVDRFESCCEPTLEFGEVFVAVFEHTDADEEVSEMLSGTGAECVEGIVTDWERSVHELLQQPPCG